MFPHVPKSLRQARVLLTVSTLVLVASCSSYSDMPSNEESGYIYSPGASSGGEYTPSRKGNTGSRPSYNTGNTGTTTANIAPPPDAKRSRLVRGQWSHLPNWSQEDPVQAWKAFRSSCQALIRKPQWNTVCRQSQQVDPYDTVAIKRFFETNFAPYRVVNDDGSVTGTITGYYEPILHGSLSRHGRYQTPLYSKPSNATRWSVTRPRAQLLSSGVLRGHELLWVDDPVDAAFLQIQGSGVIKLDSGRTIRVAFGGTNEQAFRSFASWLIQRGYITYAQATLPGIRTWAQLHPDRVEQMLNSNPRYVYFRVLPIDGDEQQGPIGALGVPLTPQRSIAVDPSRIPLGAPVYLATTQPLSGAPLHRLMVAQDTGTAIKGSVRADFFWGRGDMAGTEAGRMKQSGQMWVLMPK